MKNLASRVVVLMVVSLCTVAAFGQSNLTLKGEIPFDFNVGNQHLSSGDYTVKNLMEKVQCIRDENGTPVAFMTNALSYTGNGQAKLVFHRYGQELVLAEVWMPNAGYEVAINKKQLARIAKAGNYETIALLFEPVR